MEKIKTLQHLKGQKFLYVTVAPQTDLPDTDLPNTDPVTSSDQDEVAQEQYISWPAVFIIPRESVRIQILCRLDKKIPLTESERISLFASVFDICIKYT